jgi:anti-sigma regulatory factor (Ser/Thr protein kinase)
MYGRTNSAMQASASGHACRAEIAPTTGPPSYRNSRARQPGTAVRIPPFATRQGNSPAGDWPLQSFLELGALPGAVPCARLHARQVLWEWGLAVLSDSIELLVSELITNAVQVSRAMVQAAPVRLWLLSDGAQVVILVWDASPQPPVRIDTSDDAENGRGLLLVEATSARWGWQFPPDIGGKVVWAQTLLE